MSVRDYITGRIRWPGGPQPGTGDVDVQMVETIDLIFGDNEELKFGDDGDVYIAWDGSDLNILPLTDLTGAIKIGNGTLSMDLKVFGSASGNYMEYDASADKLNVVVATLVIDTEHHALEVTHTGTLSSGDGVVGVNAVVTPKGTAGQWASAFFGKVELTDANNPIPGTGYISGAEFEIKASSGVTPCNAFCLVLNSSMDAYSARSSYIWLHEYGAQATINLIWFYEHTRASASDSVIVSQMPQTPFDTAIRCLVGTGATPVWLYGSTVGPASIANFKWIGSGATKYLEIDASNDCVNMALMGFKWTSAAFTGTCLDFNSAVFAAGGDYNVLSYGDYANPVTISITDHCIPFRMNIISDANPGSSKMFAFQKYQFAQATEAQADLFVHAIDLGLTLTKNLQWIHAINLYMDIAETLTVTQGVHVIKAGLNLTSAKTLTYHDAAVILAEVTGAGGYTRSGPAAGELCLLMLKVAGVSTIGSMITFFTIDGCTVTNGIYVGSGPITNFIAFQNGGGQAGAKVGAACKTDSGSGVNSDGAIRILVLGTPYYIPFYSATNTDSSW